MAWVLLLAGCGALAPMPEPSAAPDFPAQPLIDIGLFGGPPELPPDYGIDELADGSAVLVVDRGNVHQVRRIQHDGERWTSLGGFDAPLMPAGDDGPALARVEARPDEGFEEPITLLIGRIPNGPVQQLELALDGEATLVRTRQPVTIITLPADTEIADRYTTLDSGTHRFDTLQIIGVELP